MIENQIKICIFVKSSFLPQSAAKAINAIKSTVIRYIDLTFSIRPSMHSLHYQL